MRRKLMQEVQKKGVEDPQVLRAIESIPRHFFLDNAFLKFAYEDKAFPIGEGQTISQPYTVAIQSELLNIQKGEKILEVGTGSGYQTAVLCELGAKVFSIERQRALYVKTKSLLHRMGYRAKLFYGDGYKGLPSFAPFNKVIVTCGAPFVPEALLKQMQTGARLVIPVGKGDVQIMTSIDKEGENNYKRLEYGRFRFVPMLEDRISGKF